MSDSIVPSPLTIDAEGRVGAEFEGHVVASGLDLPAGQKNAPLDENRVRWLRQNDGAMMAELFGAEQGELSARAHARGADETAIARLTADEETVSASAELRVETQSNQPFSPTGKVSASAGSEARTILEQGQLSSFAQRFNGGVNLVGSNRYSRGVAGWNLTAAAALTFTVAHGLGGIPVVVTGNSTPIFGAIVVHFGNFTNTTFDCTIVSTGGAVTTSGSVFWRAET